MDMKTRNTGIGVIIVGVIIWAYFGAYYAAVSMAISGGFVAASAYGPSPSSYGVSGYLLVAGIVITAIGIGIAVSGIRKGSGSGKALNKS